MFTLTKEQQILGCYDSVRHKNQKLASSPKTRAIGELDW